MKHLFLLVFLLLGLNGMALADTAVVTTADGPEITLDRSAKTYTVVRDFPTYYTVRDGGYRCYTSEQPGLGVNLLGTFVGVGGGSSVYCYSTTP